MQGRKKMQTQYFAEEEKFSIFISFAESLFTNTANANQNAGIVLIHEQRIVHFAAAVSASRDFATSSFFKATRSSRRLRASRTRVLLASAWSLNEQLSMKA